ncbi:DUF6268 family outer membrane beta-barrel protein [Nonlabens ponticola]|uniref:DUF6268 domain-containing protein n=1 Tax=Nonlabens ponticola TaxID=2496866 RepID=A0A3S9N045_9FLAO|nr:DUF6268 family outer membrane beta-barrel protein [Nonlabens ponticola]AZQ44744.1 hypothetical protein EJ995_11060 [Nonlabens ponticola]
MKKSKTTSYMLVMIVVFLAFAKANSQATDLARVEYTYFPQRNSDNSFRRFRTFINIPLKIKEGTYIVPFFEYRNVHFLIRDDDRFREFGTDRYESYEGAIGYTFPMKKDWRFGSRAGFLFASNFDSGSVEKDDIFFSGSVYFIKDATDNFKTKPWRLVVGVQYSTRVGRPFPLPYINYYREFAPDWSYSVGAPKMNLKYRFNDKNSVQLYARLDGFYANIQNNVVTDDDQIADNASLTTVVVGPGYQYNLTRHLSLYAYVGYTAINDIRLRNEDGDDVKNINDSNTFYSRVGLKFKI